MIVDEATAGEFIDEGFIETARDALIEVFPATAPALL
jgi:hypothetical protein